MSLRPLLLLCLALLCSPALAGSANFEQCLQAAANAWAREYGTSMRFVDPWHKQSETQQYPYWVDKSTRNTGFVNVNTSPPEPSIAFDSTQVNDACTTTNTFHLSKEVTHTNTFTFSITETLAIENSIEVEVKVPEIGGIKDTTKISMSVSSTQTATSTDTSTWSISEDVPIAPREKKVITAVVSTESFDADYTYVVDFSGYVPIWFNDKIDFNRAPGQGSDFHWLWFVPVQSVLQKAIQTGSPACSGFTAWPAQFNGRGHVSGVLAINVAVNTVTTRLSPCEGQTSALKDSAPHKATIFHGKPTILSPEAPTRPAPGPRSRVVLDAAGKPIAVGARHEGQQPKQGRRGLRA